MSFTDPQQPGYPDHPPSQLRSSTPSKQPPNSVRLGCAILWAVVVLVAGGALASYCVLRFGERGLFVVWPIGWGGGVVASKILGGRSKVVGGLLVVACFGITLFAELSWIHENIEGADESWFKTISLLPAFARQFQISAFIAMLLAIFGATAAWRAVAARYVLVRFDD